jgi:glycosyltransferase involved in cell wall biosynthesis
MDTPRHVCILVENLPVPSDRRVWQQALTLTRAGAKVSVVCPQGTSRETAPFEERDGVTIYRYPARFAGGGIMSYAREYASALWHMRGIVRRLVSERPLDVVQACNPPDVLLFSALSARRRGAAFIFDQHDLVPEMSLSHFAGKKLLYRATLIVERFAYRLADVVLVTTDSYHDVARTRGHKTDDEVFVVRNSPDLSFFRPLEPDPSLKQGAEFLIGYMGIIGYQDGVDHTLRALSELRTRRTDWRAIFIGEGEALEEMRELSRRLELSDVVEFLGWMTGDALVVALSSIDVCVAPNPKTPLNDVSTMVKLLEYMAMAKPVVAYDLRETLRVAGDAAAYGKANEPSTLADAIDGLLDDPARRAEMGALGRTRVETVLSLERAEANLLAAYEKAYEAHDRRCVTGGRKL